MIRDLFYKLFKRPKVENFDTRISKLEYTSGNLSSISVESLEKSKDNYALILELQNEIEDLKNKMKVLYVYIVEEKWDTKN